MHYSLGILFVLITLTIQRVLVHSEVSKFSIDLNRIRNQVASGMQQGWKSAANMNALTWSDSLAYRAENCAKMMPGSPKVCDKYSSPSEYGLTIWKRNGVPTHQINAKGIIDHWMQSETNSKQLLVGRAKQFGCAFSEDANQEIVVCYYDKPYLASQGAAYVEGLTGSACAQKAGVNILGNHFSGLCPSNIHHLQLVHAKHHEIQGQHNLKGQHKHHTKQLKHRHHGGHQHHQILVNTPTAKNWGENTQTFVEAEQWFNQHDDAVFLLDLHGMDFMY